MIKPPGKLGLDIRQIRHRDQESHLSFGDHLDFGASAKTQGVSNGFGDNYLIFWRYLYSHRDVLNETLIDINIVLLLIC